VLYAPYVCHRITFTSRQRHDLSYFSLQLPVICRGYILVMIRYIKNIDISFSISIYRIVSYRQKISNFSIYRDTF